MAKFPSLQTPPCERCGLPIVEAHYPDGRCPRPPVRSVRRRVTRGVLGALAGLIAFAFVAVVIAGVLRSPSISLAGRIPLPGPLRPRLQACELFYRWEVTGKTSLLNRAAADALSPRVPSQSKVRFQEDFSGLRSWIRLEKHADSSLVPYSLSDVVHNYGHAIQGDCNPLARDWPILRRDAAKARRAAGHLRHSSY